MRAAPAHPVEGPDAVARAVAVAAGGGRRQVGRPPRRIHRCRGGRRGDGKGAAGAGAAEAPPKVRRAVDAPPGLEVPDVARGLARRGEAGHVAAAVRAAEAAEVEGLARGGHGGLVDDVGQAAEAARAGGLDEALATVDLGQGGRDQHEGRRSKEKDRGRMRPAVIANIIRGNALVRERPSACAGAQRGSEGKGAAG